MESFVCAKINVKNGLKTYMKMLYAPLHYNSDQQSSRESKHNSFHSNFLHIATNVSCFCKLLTGSWLDVVELEVSYPYFGVKNELWISCSRHQTENSSMWTPVGNILTHDIPMLLSPVQTVMIVDDSPAMIVSTFIHYHGRLCLRSSGSW